VIMSEIKPINTLPSIALYEWIRSLSRSSSYFCCQKTCQFQLFPDEILFL
jgi:hypothetical protein